MDEQSDQTSSERGRSQMSEGITLARAGDQESARAVFRRIIHQEPDNEDAWLWLAWVAESRAQSLRYLREAQALLPDSKRIEEAVAWASQDAAVHVGTPDSEVRKPAPSRPTESGRDGSDARSSRPRPADEPSARAAVSAAQAFGAGVQRVKGKLAGLRQPRPERAPRRPLSMPMVSLLSVLGMALVVIIGIRLARSTATPLLALTLPTPVADPTSTPTVDQLTEQLWVQADVAFSQANWDMAVQALQRIREIDPYSDQARKQLAAACYQRGLTLISANDLESARVELDSALRLDSSYQPLQELRRQLKLYVDGVAAYWAKDWPLAVQRLKKVYELNPAFRDTKTMLAQAYYEVGVERAQAEVWDEARDALEASLALEAERADAQAVLTEVMAALIPPRRVVVDITDQIVTVYQDNAPIYTFKCCTGRSTAPTLPGRYSILDKMPMAYASKWDLDMPWWLGIYFAGGSENGFHALPLLNSRQVLWRSSLGTPCSFGCIVLDTDDAKTLYDWAEIGTTVLVNW